MTPADMKTQSQRNTMFLTNILTDFSSNLEQLISRKGQKNKKIHFFEGSLCFCMHSFATLNLVQHPNPGHCSVSWEQC